MVKQRYNITMEDWLHNLAAKKGNMLGENFSEYVRNLIKKDIKLEEAMGVMRNDH